MLQVGVAALEIGALIFFASRNLNGGWAVILLSALISWFAFELALSVVRGIRRVRTRVQPRHTILGGCLTVVAACGLGGLVLFFGQQLILGVVLGGVAALLTDRTRLPTLAQMGGLDLMPDPAGAKRPSMWVLPSRPVAALIALSCLLFGIALGGLGTFRILEGYSYATDTACAHPCGMVHGLWVQVLPDAHGDFVTRLDSAEIKVRERFSDDVAGGKIASRSGFTVTNLPAIYQQMADRQGCDAWAPRVLHLGDSTGDLTICFAIPQSQEPDISQLILDWAEAGVTAPILLGKKARSGVGIDMKTG